MCRKYSSIENQNSLSFILRNSAGITLDRKERSLNYMKETIDDERMKTTIETKYKDNGDIEYEFKEIYHLK